MRFHHHNAIARRESPWQPENHLHKICVRHCANNVCRDIKALIVRVNEIDQDRRRRLARGKLKVPYENNHSRVSIAAEVE